MKKIFTILLLMLIVSVTQATKYYFSQSGSDSNNGLSTLSPKKTITHLNTLSLSPLDSVLFKKGDTWTGEMLNINDMGADGSPITFGAYGTGASPIISGFTSVTAWTNLGSNIWESTNAVSTLTTCNLVTINGDNTEMGRYPNSTLSNGGFLTIASHPTATSLTCSALTGTPDWTGAEIVIRENDWTFSKRTVTSQSGTTINYNSSCGAPTNYGFFFQNDVRTLDTQNEWYYNPTTKKIRVYSTSQPTNVKVATVDNLIKFDYQAGSNWSYTSYITIDGIDFSGANGDAVWGWQHLAAGHKLNGVIIKNCNFSFSSAAAMSFQSNGVTIENCSINHSNGKAVDVTYSTDVLIKNNSIQNTGLFAGMGVQFSALQIGGASDTIVVEHNSILNSGHNAISFAADNTTIRYNFIDTFNSVIDDGGGIYGGSNATITRNVIVNGVGAWEGTSRTVGGLVIGIYLDDNSHDNTVTYNSVSDVYWAGIYLHNAHTNVVRYNTVFDCDMQLRTADDALGGDIYDNTISNNIFVAKESTQWCLNLNSNQNNLTTIGTFNNNVYARPIDDNLSIYTSQPSASSVSRNLTGWQTFSSQDANSTKSPKAISSASDIEFRYNETATPKQVSFPWAGIDMNGTQYSSNPTLQPYTSLVLIKNIPNPSGTKKPAGKNGIMYKTRTGLPIGGE